MSANSSPGDTALIGDANVASKEKEKKTKKGKLGPSPAPRENGNTPDQINPRTGYRNRRFGCGSEFHLLPRSRGKQPQAARKVSIAMVTPNQDGNVDLGGGVYATFIGSDSTCGGLGRPSKVILDTGASANLVGADWLNNHNAILKALGRPQAKITPAFASFRYGDGRVRGAHRAAIIPIPIAGYTGRYMAYVVDADIPLEMGPVGHYLLNVVDFPESNGAGMSVARNGGNAKCVANNKGTARKNVLFFTNVTPMTTMRPAGEGGPPLTLSCLEMEQFEPAGLRPGGEISPSPRLDGFQPETADITHQAPSTYEAMGKRSTLPI